MSSNGNNNSYGYQMNDTNSALGQNQYGAPVLHQQQDGTFQAAADPNNIYTNPLGTMSRSHLYGAPPGAAPSGMNYTNYPQTNSAAQSIQGQSIDLTGDADDVSGGAASRNPYHALGRYAMGDRSPSAYMTAGSAQSPVPEIERKPAGFMRKQAMAASNGLPKPNPQLPGSGKGQAQTSTTKRAGGSGIGNADVAKSTPQKSSRQPKAKKSLDRQLLEKQLRKEGIFDKPAPAQAAKKQGQQAAKKRMNAQAARAAQAEASGDFDDQQKAFDATGSNAYGLSSPVPQPLDVVAPPPKKARAKKPQGVEKKPTEPKKKIGRPKKEPQAKPTKKKQPETGDLIQLKQAKAQKYAEHTAETLAATPASEVEDDDSDDDDEDDSLFSGPTSLVPQANIWNVQVAQPKFRPVYSARDIAEKRGGTDMPPFGSLPGEEDLLDENDDRFGDGQAELDEERAQEKDMDMAGEKEEYFEEVLADIKSTVWRIGLAKQEDACCEQLGVPEDQRYGTKIAMPEYKLEQLANIALKVNEFGNDLLRENGLDFLVGHLKFTGQNLYEANKLPRVVPDERTVLPHGGVLKEYVGDEKVNLMVEQLHFMPGTMRAAVQYDAYGDVEMAVGGRLDGRRYVDVDVFSDESEEYVVDKEEQEAETGEAADGDARAADGYDVAASHDQLPTPEKSQGATSSPVGLSEKTAGKKRKLEDDCDDPSSSKKAKLEDDFEDDFNDDSDDGFAAKAGSSKKKKNHKPMNKAEQLAALAFWEGRLEEFNRVEAESKAAANTEAGDGAEANEDGAPVSDGSSLKAVDTAEPAVQETEEPEAGLEEASGQPDAETPTQFASGAYDEDEPSSDEDEEEDERAAARTASRRNYVGPAANLAKQALANHSANNTPTPPAAASKGVPINPSLTVGSVIGSGTTAMVAVAAPQPSSDTTPTQQQTMGNCSAADQSRVPASSGQSSASVGAANSSAADGNTAQHVEQPATSAAAAAVDKSGKLAGSSKPSAGVVEANISARGNATAQSAEEPIVSNAASTGGSPVPTSSGQPSAGVADTNGSATGNDTAQQAEKPTTSSVAQRAEKRAPEDTAETGTLHTTEGAEADVSWTTYTSKQDDLMMMSAEEWMAHNILTQKTRLPEELDDELFNDEEGLAAAISTVDSQSGEAPTSTPTATAGADKKRKRTTENDADDGEASQPLSKQPKMAAPAAVGSIASLKKKMKKTF
ncbi:hypothetical protein LTR85_008902 [Meristemomyces frigidus]|nr:hypothetical protein LTR85_008902 [Meristemomyces frigidus]